MKGLAILSSSLLVLAGCSSTPSPDLSSAINQDMTSHPSASGKRARSAPELFNDFGVVQKPKKELPVKSVKGRNRSVKVNAGILWSDALTLTLFEDKIVTVVRDRIIDKVKGSTTWIGHVEGELDSEVFITARGSSMAGTVRIGQELYEISQGANNLHEITKIDPGKNPEFGDDSVLVDDYTMEEAELNSSPSAPQIANAELTTGTIIDVMVVYTPQARINASGQSGIESKIVNAIAKANQAYINSQIDMQINLVHMAETNYTESGSTSTSLQAITSTSDGNMDEVHSLRNQYGADQVVLVSADTSACGTGYLMTNPSTSFAGYAFSVVHDDSRYACLSNHTLAHELGHNQGDHHDSDNATAGAYSYSYGYRLCQTGGFRTVMSYNCSGGTRVGQFSNPNVTYNGEYTGTSSANNALSMMNTKAIVASFRGAVDTSTPNSPSNLTTNTLSDTEITINWSDNANNETGFRLVRSTDSINWSEFATINSNITSFTDTGLTPETNYQYKARAYNSNGNSAFSNASNSTTDTPVIEACVNNNPQLGFATATQYSQAGASISYDISLTNQDTSICGLSTFSISSTDGSSIGSYSLSPGNTANTKWSSTAPTTDGNYTKTITAISAGHSNITKSVTVLVDSTAPTAPVNLTTTEKRKSQVGVSWGSSTDNGSGFKHYVVKRNGSVIATTTSTSLTDKPGTGTHTYLVEAYDNAGNMNSSNTSLTIGGGSTTTKGKGRKK